MVVSGISVRKVLGTVIVGVSGTIGVVTGGPSVVFGGGTSVNVDGVVGFVVGSGVYAVPVVCTGGTSVGV